MKVKTALLKSALRDLSTVVCERSTVPLLAYVHLNTFNDLELSVTDFDQFMMRKIEFDGEIGSICVHFNQFSNVLGDAEFTTIIKEENAIIVKCGSKLSRLSILEAKDFPSMPEMNFKAIGVSCAELAAGIRAVHGFEHKNRDPVTSLQIEGTAKSIVCAATDGLQYARHVQLLISAEFKHLIHANFCDNLAYALEGKGATLSCSDSMLYVSADDVEYFCKFTEHKWPDSVAFLTHEFKPIGVIQPETLIAELESCLVFREITKSPVMDVDFEKDKVTTHFTGSGSQLENSIPGEFNPCHCKVNVESFLKCLRRFKEKVNISNSENVIRMDSGDMTIYMGKMRE
jgi:DNA polymerase III sliding clamp (beta) subunit (PCNA family)